MQKIVFATVIFLYYKLNPNSRLRHCIKSSIVVLWNILSFPFLQVLRSLEPPALTFYNVVLGCHYKHKEMSLRNFKEVYKILMNFSLVENYKKNLNLYHGHVMQ